MNAVEPPYNANNGKPGASGNYIFMGGFVFSSILIVTFIYTIYMCKHSQSPPPPTISIGDDTQDHHVITFSQGVDDDVLVTFPTFVYSETPTGDGKDSGCSICLADYKPEDVIRLLPECGHIYHVECIDMWLKAHSTCPVCRNSALAEKVPLPVQQS